MNKKSILVLGGNGFIGSHLIKYLNINVDKNDYEILSVDLELPLNYDHNNFLTYYKLDISKPVCLLEFLGRIKPSIVINLTGVIRSDCYKEFYRLNVEISQVLLDYAVSEKSIEKILLIGSAAEYGIPCKNPVNEDDELNPINLYGLSKVLQTQIAKFYARNLQVPVVIARTFNLYGDKISRDLAIGNWKYQIDRAENNSTIKFGNLEYKRDYLNVDEAVKYYWLLIKHGIPGEVYNVCSGVPVKMRILLVKMIEESNKKINIEIDSKLYKTDDIPMIYGNNTKLLNLLHNN